MTNLRDLGLEHLRFNTQRFYRRVRIPRGGGIGWERRSEKLQCHTTDSPRISIRKAVLGWQLRDIAMDLGWIVLRRSYTHAYE